MARIFICIICLVLFSKTNAQQTVGLFLNTPEAFDGYTLFGNNTKTYLINNCGFTVNIWESDQKPGLSMYLLENGQLLRSTKVDGAFQAGGSGGGFELLDWDSNVEWSYELATNEQHSHHDIAPLPNGNFLAIAWERHSQAEAQQVGRANNGEVWSEKIVEIQPTGTNEASIVWEWRLWDHLVQDQDIAKPNYGNIADFPERVNINYFGTQPNPSSDWIHLNSINYNPVLDQIMVSSRNFSEVWIIDHSTSTAQAASSSGGNANKGGDLLYRYGNPLAYQRGTVDEQVFSGQHDARWIQNGGTYDGKLMVFNNNYAFNESRVVIWTPPTDENEHYVITEDQAFGPEMEDWYYAEPGFFSTRISGAHFLPNDNILICEGQDGRFFEINPSTLETVWEYVNPINMNGGPTAQGGTIHFNDSFRATKYSPDYPGLANQDLTPGLPVEINPWDSDCEIYIDTPTEEKFASASNLKILGNPVQNDLMLEYFGDEPGMAIVVYSALGHAMQTASLHLGVNQLHTADFPAGLYFLQPATSKKISRGGITFLKVD